jgi:prepilin-type N-terminal cleavage/methylation domain-containing protein
MHCQHADASGCGRAGSPRRLRVRAGAPGFTLLESMMALVIIGVGILAFVDAHAAFSRSNTWSSQAATGMLLANEVREFTRHMTRHDPVTGLTLTGSGSSATLTGWGVEANEPAVDDLDDLDDLDQIVFGAGGDFPGPIDGFGNIVPEIDLQGNLVLDGQGEVVPMRGWRQVVTVEKVDPYDFGRTRANAFEQAASSQLPAITVGSFPLRVTVVVEFTPPGATQAEEITRLTWITPP